MSVIQSYCAVLNTQSIANNRKKLAQNEPKLVSSLVHLMDSPSLKVQCQAALALRNLASDGMEPLVILCSIADYLHREISARNRACRWPLAVTSALAILIPTPYFVECRMRSKCVYTSR